MSVELVHALCAVINSTVFPAGSREGGKSEAPCEQLFAELFTSGGTENLLYSISCLPELL